MQLKNIFDFSYAKRSHFAFFSGLSKIFYNVEIDPENCVLKNYQDLFVFSFIRDNISRGSRILDVGGGDSRILRHFADDYDCWNIDRLEGCGNGPKELASPSYRLIYDYMGNFNPDLPDESFDFVFSISVLEHVPQKNTELYDRIAADINRVLKPGGYSLHLVDVRVKDDTVIQHQVINRLFEERVALIRQPNMAAISLDPDTFYMSEAVYEARWRRVTKLPYKEFGRPTSINILWRKP